jgi:hypothetical protein
MMRRRLIEVEYSSDGHDSFEIRRSFNSSFHLGSGEITDSNHADIAVRPGLLSRPLNEVVHITTLLPIEETEDTARSIGAPAVSNHVDVTSGDEEIAGASFNEARRRTKVLNLSRVGRGGN